MERAELHEFWVYNDASGFRTLDGVALICPRCHEVLHMPLALRKGRGGYALAHLREVNGWSYAEALAHLGEAFTAWEVRSKQTWLTNLLPINLPEAAYAVASLDDLSFAEEQLAAKGSRNLAIRTLQLQADPVTDGYAHQENH